MDNKERKQACMIKLSEALNRLYGSKYTWNISTYTNAHNKVEGYCIEHKCILYFTPTSIYRGTLPCKKCKCAVVDTESFIFKANKVHGGKYSYLNAVYTAYHKPTTITCSKHGDFSQRVSDHLAGKGCNKCANNIQSQDEIVERFKSVHKDIYDYSKVLYKNMHTKVKIICPKHGEFYQKPSDHIFNLQGCPSCGSSCFSTQKPGTFYVLKVLHEDKVYYKIGITNKSLKQRYSSKHDKSRIKQCFKYTFKNGYLAQDMEYKLLQYFRMTKANINILLSGNTEILTQDVRKTKYFKELFNEQRNKDTRRV